MVSSVSYPQFKTLSEIASIYGISRPEPPLPKRPVKIKEDHRGQRFDIKI